MRILNLQEIAELRPNNWIYKNQMAVFLSKPGADFDINQHQPVCVNAYTYALVLAGTSSLLVNDRDFSVDAHTLCVFSPLHLTQFHDMSDDFQVLFLCMHTDFLDRLTTYKLGNHIALLLKFHPDTTLPVDDAEKDIIRECMEYIRLQLSRTGHHFQLEMLQNALVRFYLEMDNILFDKHPDSETAKSSRDAKRLQQLMDLLTKNFRSEHYVSFYAERMNMTPQHLVTIVKQISGHTVSDFIFEMLICEARYLLGTTDKTVQEIADFLHFSDQNSFCKFFKKRTGRSPLEFRKLLRPAD